MPRWFTRNDNWDFGGTPSPGEGESREPKSRKRRLATTFVFTTLFFAGASLAAVAGDRLSATIPSDDVAAMDDTSTSPDAASAAPADDSAAPAEAAAPADDSAASAATAAAASHDLSAPADSATAADAPAAAGSDQGFSPVDSSSSSTQSAAIAAGGPAPKLTPKQTAAQRARARP